MEIILIILTSAILSVALFTIYHFGYDKGLSEGKALQKKEDSANMIDITDQDDEMLKLIEKQYNFIKYGKGE